MDTIVFDGREFAANKVMGLKIKSFELLCRGVKPKLVSILIGDNEASKLYLSMKQKFAEKVGAEVEIYEIGLRKDIDYVVRLIKYLNTKEDVHGIMVQLPLPPRLKNYTDEIINSIDPAKDVDGLREDSPYIHPTVLAVLQIIEIARKYTKIKKIKNLPHSDGKKHEVVCVIGASGMVGKPLVKELRKRGFTVLEADEKTKELKEIARKAKIVISATGIPGVIRSKTVRKGGVVSIDVGSPKGDFNYEEIKRKSMFITPVPGGVGPVTISCLLENLIQAANMIPHEQ